MGKGMNEPLAQHARRQEGCLQSTPRVIKPAEGATLQGRRWSLPNPEQYESGKAAKAGEGTDWIEVALSL